ncbi:hypothetical protein [Mycolicibacterium vinylchloridicum]|uniref:hypothetical protein n=1 Tax=Mycolicibacterium vinylchloridicum TaxID=2736928 RepID=UPI001F33FDC5|nr:hypothetical protein [Mycolicibacterium vinylchloridicum]
MSVEARPRRRFFRRRNTETAHSDNLLSYTDQTLFIATRATDQEAIIQATWIYEHPVDYEALHRFYDNFGYGLAGRLIERSPLPFGRHRWVSSLGAPLDIEIAEPRPRSELSDWCDERSQLPVDAEWGPGWRIGILPMTDGSTAISMCGSHCLGDGIAAAMRAFEAINGITPDLGYPPPRSRTRSQAIVEDLRQAARDFPATFKALVALISLLYKRRAELRGPKSSPLKEIPAFELKRNVLLPAVSLSVDLTEWDARAEALKGNGHSLIAGFAAKIAEHIGRVNAQDGTVTLMTPISDRALVDTDNRANAVAIANVKFDPKDVCTDLTAARDAMRTGVKNARAETDEVAAILPLVPLLPKRIVGAIAGAALGFSGDLPVSCSNVGDLPAELLGIDGTQAEYLFFRGTDRRVTREALERRSGLLTILAARMGGHNLITVVGYQPGWDNTTQKLREVVEQTLKEFDLPGTIV